MRPSHFPHCTLGAVTHSLQTLHLTGSMSSVLFQPSTAARRRRPSFELGGGVGVVVRVCLEADIAEDMLMLDVVMLTKSMLVLVVGHRNLARGFGGGDY